MSKQRRSRRSRRGASTCGHYNTGGMDELNASSRAAAAIGWTGAAVFMLSLNGGFVAFLWWMRASEGPAASAFASAVINGLLFSLFALHHSLLARTGAKRRVRSVVGAHLERSVYVWIASLLYIAVWALWRDLPGTLYRHTGVWAAVHWAIVVLGFAL